METRDSRAHSGSDTSSVAVGYEAEPMSARMIGLSHDSGVLHIPSTISSRSAASVEYRGSMSGAATGSVEASRTVPRLSGARSVTRQENPGAPLPRRSTSIGVSSTSGASAPSAQLRKAPAWPMEANGPRSRRHRGPGSPR